MLEQLEDWPTNSTGKTQHFFAMVTFLSGEDTTAFGIMCWVWLNHQRLVSLSTWKKSKLHHQHQKMRNDLTQVWWNMKMRRTKYLALEGNRSKHSVESTLSVSCDKDKIVTSVVDIPHLKKQLNYATILAESIKYWRKIIRVSDGENVEESGLQESFFRLCIRKHKIVSI